MGNDEVFVPSDDNSEDERHSVTTFEGTGAECVSWLQTHFAIMTKIVEGALMSADDEDKQGFEDILDAVKRSVYRVSVEPLDGMVAKRRVRPEYEARVARIETALELFDTIAASQTGPTHPDE